MNEPSESVVSDVACTVCGCVCDDLRVHVADGKVRLVEGSCPLSDPWFAALNDVASTTARIEGAAVSHDQAVDHAARILGQAKSPLIFGLSRSSTAGQRAAVRLAEQLGANIDTTASICHGPSIMAIQQVGESTCSLGEVRNRADLVIFWGADPAVSHPRHFERYSADPVGQFVPNGRAGRNIVVIDTKKTATAELADVFFQIRPGRDFETIWALRQMIAGHVVEPSGELGLPADQLRQLADLMVSCRYGAVFFGLGLAQTGIAHANVEALLRLVAELNRYTRFTARRLRIPGDVTGADCVLCWWTGFPFAVNLSRGFPRYNPGEYSATELLERREVDACLLVGSECVEGLTSMARQSLSTIPTIVLEYPHIPVSFVPAVQFVTAIYGVHAAGTAYRMDEVPIPLKRFLHSELPTDEQVLGRIQERVTAVATH